MQERYLAKALELTTKDSIGVPLWVSARRSANGAVVSWTADVQNAAGYNVYEDGKKLNQQMLPQNVHAFALPGNGRSRVNVTVVDSQGREGGFSATVSVVKGDADVQPPLIVLISPPTVLQQGQRLQFIVRLLDEAVYNLQEAFVYWRLAGTASWQKANLLRKTKAIFCADIACNKACLIECYVEASDGRKKAHFPVGAPGGASLICMVLPSLYRQLPAPSISCKDKGKTIELNSTNVSKKAWYVICRSAQPGFAPSLSNRVTMVPALSLNQFTDNGLDFEGKLLKGKYYYRVGLSVAELPERIGDNEICIEW